MIAAILWPVLFFFVVVIGIVYFSPTSPERQKAKQHQSESETITTGVTAQERENAAILSRQTVEAQASLRQAEIEHQAAEIRASTELIAATANDRIEAERRIIAAAAEARITFIQNHPAHPTALTGKCLEELSRGYQDYTECVEEDSVILAEWLGTVDLPDDPTALSPLIDMYIAFNDATDEILTFAEWSDKLPLRQATTISLTKPVLVR